MTQEEYLDKAAELGRKHYNEYMALDMAFIKENRKADNGDIVYNAKTRKYYKVQCVELSKKGVIELHYHCYCVTKDGRGYLNGEPHLLKENEFKNITKENQNR